MESRRHKEFMCRYFYHLGSFTCYTNSQLRINKIKYYNQPYERIPVKSIEKHESRINYKDIQREKDLIVEKEGVKHGEIITI